MVLSTDTTAPPRERARHRQPQRRRPPRWTSSFLVGLLALALTGAGAWVLVRPLVHPSGSDVTLVMTRPAATSAPAPPAAEGLPSSTPAAPVTPEASAEPSAPAVPPLPAVPRRGNGIVTPVDVPSPPAPVPGRAVTYSVEIEGGLPVDAADLAATVQTVLLAARGWQKEDGVSFRPVKAAAVRAGARPDIRVTLASPSLTDRLCAPLETGGEVSCWNNGRAVLNARRWILGAASYGAALPAYRTYLISHEVGHGLGHGHVHCPRRGAPALVMMQQTLSLQGCTAWPWPVQP